MIRQTEHEIEDVISRLNIGDKFTLYSETTTPNNKQYRIVSYEDDMVCVRILETLKICGTFENIQAFRHHLLGSYDSGSICACVINNDNSISSNQMSLSEFTKELHKLKDNAYLHLWNFKDEVTSYKVIMNWDYDAPYSITLRNLTKNDTNYDITARNISQVIDTFIDLFKNDIYCRCEVVIPGESSNTTNKSTGIHPIIAIRDEDKIDVIQDNTYIRLIEPDETEYEYIVSINPNALYTSQIVSLHGVHKTNNNPTYSSLDELKRALKTDIKNGKYDSIEVIQLTPIVQSNYTEWENNCLNNYITPHTNSIKHCSNSNYPSQNNLLASQYKYKYNEIVHHKEYGIGFVVSKDSVNVGTALQIMCEFSKNLNFYTQKKPIKYCLPTNITPYYPTLDEIKKNILTCYIILKNGNTFKYLLKYLSAPYMDSNTKKSIISGKYKEQQKKNYNIAVVQIKQGEIVDIIYVNNKWFANIKCYDINMSNNTLIDTNTHKYVQEESKMKELMLYSPQNRGLIKLITQSMMLLQQKLL